jgi:myo-inositol-1(or 4)-monophosphatase
LISLNYEGIPKVGLANFPKLNKYYINLENKSSYIFENGIKKKLKVSKNIHFNKIKVAGAFHGWLSIKKQKKIPKVLKLMQFPCTDALSYTHLAEGKIDVVIQCSNKIWDIHPIIPIVKAAGGYISTWKNEDAIKAGNILVSCNKDIHKKMLKLLKPAL